VRVVPFEAIFSGPRRDERLREKLLDELSGILNWALDGCQEWQEHGLGDATKMRAATSAYRVDSDLIARFIDECCTLSPNAIVRKPALYSAFAGWAKLNGERNIPAARSLHADLRSRGFREGASHGADVFRGIGLRDDDRSQFQDTNAEGIP
jgi:putative DNA primase/helicase